MSGFLLFLSLVLFHTKSVRGAFCDNVQYTLINEIRRSTAFKSAPPYICDRGFIKDNKWYRFDSVAGKTMATKNPGILRCGTYIPIWLQGEHPTKENDVLNVKACAAIPYMRPAGCGVSYNIKVVKCPGGFFLYKLKMPVECSFAYCAGDKLPRDCSPNGEWQPICPGAIPRVSVQAEILEDENSAMFETVTLRCFWQSPGNLTYVEYEARWFGDTKDLQHKIERNFTGQEAHEFLFERGVGDKRETGYEFHKNVYCAVRTRYKTGTWSRWFASNQIYTGIEVTPTFIPIEDCGEDQREVIITLRPHLPIRQTALKIDFYKETNQLIDEICVVGGETLSNCVLVFPPNHPVGRPIRFKLMTTCATSDNTAHTQSFNYSLKHVHDGTSNSFWTRGHSFPELKIIRRKFVQEECKSTADPHIRTFDGKKYNFFGRGTFLLYRNRYFGTEIQVRHKACNEAILATPSCNCGVAIKENLFYKIYDMCHDAPNRGWWKNKVVPNLNTYQLRDFELSRFYTSITADGSSDRYEVTLPSGVKVIFKRHSWGLNIHVFAPVDLEHPSEGLCGNNNGDTDDDFDGWKTHNEFGEHWRIRTPITLFEYKGNRYEEAQLDDGCDKKICICSERGKAVCDETAKPICFPTLSTKKGRSARATHQGSGIGDCGQSRTTRALMPDDDTVDDQDTILPFNPTVTSVNVTLTWPTPSGYTRENVTNFCEKKIRYSQAGKACGQLPDVDVEGIVEQCVTDIQATEDFSWGVANFAALETSCIATVLKNISSFKNTTDGSIQLDTDILMSLCPNDCSDKGACKNSTCVCHEDYTAADCSISLKARPLVYDIRKSGLCDRRRRPCRNVGVYAFPLLASENLTCHVQEYKVIESAWIPDNTIFLYPGLLVDLTEVKCLLPESPVNVGDYGNEGITAAGLNIAVSNNRINVSEQSVSFITYDSVCQECNATTGCKLRADACLISGHCFAKSEGNPSDWCQQCIPELSQNLWRKRGDNGRPFFATSQTFYTFKGQELRVQLNGKDPENRTVYFSFVTDETFQAFLTKNGLFTWTKNTNDSTVFRFKVTDECGAYSILNVSVIIKECQCKNSGECKPDYRFLDGAGNFTCSCPTEYTGTLCEIDVNECAMSVPCFNGRCINEEPGFSCSCFAGYTGELCQTELNECASNPCFLGVSCKDMVATFKCGTCPSGYSGDGKTCSKVNGEIDPCVKDPKICHKEANCVNENGSFVCQCRHGFKEDGNNSCTDINECVETPHICHANAHCSNIAGSFSCKCVRGYKGDGQRNCSDVDECRETPHFCDPNANCTNNAGSYSCECLRGYTGDGRSNCSDIDECTQLPFVCHENAKCVNGFGSYICQCDKGYFGDGKINCTENKPPVIKTPSSVYGILNMDFKIQIEAQDPEGENIVFVPMSNSTETKIRITENGLLTISNLKNNSAVHILVEDKKGAQNVLILDVKAMPCPCEHNGKCYKKRHIRYPVRKSDYICHCDKPYTGGHCETRTNPCGEQPCFPGLKCSPALNSEGFTCERCPPLFKGDGKSCELKNVKGGESIHVEAKMTLKDEKWSEQLTVKTSKVYRELVSRITVEVRKIYSKMPEFGYFIVKNFSSGSVVVDFQLIFLGKTEAPLAPLLKKARTGQFGNMTFEMHENESDPEDDKNGSKIRIYLVVVIIVVIVVLFVIIVLVVLFRVRRQRMYRVDKLRKDEKDKGTSAAEGIATGEEVPLKLFGDEAEGIDEE